MTARLPHRSAPRTRPALFAASLAAAGLAGCGGDENEFVSGDPNVHTSPVGYADAGLGLPPPPPPPPAPDPGGDDADRAIAEADIVQMRGDTLYALSRRAGLAVVDLETPSEPELVGRHRPAGTGVPFEMYVREGVALAMYRSWSRWTPDGFQATSSRIEAIDVSDPTAPERLGSFDVPGRLSDSRIVGDVLYVASFEDGSCYRCASTRRTTITSLAVGEPQAIEVIDELAITTDDPAAYSWSRSITTTAERMYVGGVSWSGGEPNGSTIDVVDISDPEGDLVRGDAVQVAGQIASRWQMDEHEGVLRVISQPAGWGLPAPRIQTFAVESSQSLVSLGSAPIELPRPESLQSVRFDGDRGYAITFQRTDPLFTIDLSDPAAPRVVGELEIPGWVYHMEPRGDRLIGLGFERGNPDGSLHVSLFDVSDLAEPTMLERVHFGGDWGSLAEDQDRIHKALRVLDERGLILVPYAGWRSGPQCGAYDSGIQLIDLARDGLTRRGVAATGGAARRALFHEDRLVTMTDEAVQVFDAGDRDAPDELAKVTLASQIRQAATVGDVVARVSKHRASGLADLEIVSADDPEALEPLGTLDLGELFDRSGCGSSTSARLFAAPPHLWIAARIPGEPTMRVAAVDVSDPAAPTVAGSIDVAVDDRGLRGYGDLVDSGERAVKVGTSLVLRDVRDSGDGVSARIEVVDLADPEAPASRTVTLPDALGYTGLVAGEGEVALSHWSSAGPGRVRFYLDRVPIDRPAPPAVEVTNVPGSLLAVGDGRAMTIDYRRSARHTDSAVDCYGDGGTYQRDAERCVIVHRTLKLVELGVDGAEVIDAHELAAATDLDRPVLGDDRVFTYASGSLQPDGVLVVSGLRSGALDLARVRGDGRPRVIAADGTRALVSGATSFGLRSLDAASMSGLALERHGPLRTYARNTRLEGDRALCALGYDGLQVLDLTD